ncbi:MAG: hypothetical protein GQ477_05655 [Nanohaloarchaea archaeon]|nr:hypothetical protein [Candidatus Nanohaloarchaea archaeon]
MAGFNAADMEFDRNILQALLYYSTTEDDFMLPTIEEFILSEVVNGTLEYLDRDAGKVRYRTRGFDRNSFEKEIWNYFEEESSLSDREIDSDVMASIERMASYHIVYPDGPDGPYSTAGLYSCFKTVLPSGAGMSSTFSLSQEVIYRVKKEVILSLSEAVRGDVEGIGKIMRRYINEDLGYIRKKYRW